MGAHTRRAGRRPLPAVPLGLALLLTAAATHTAGSSTYAAFVGTTKNESSSFSSGTVTIGDNDADAAMFTMTNLKPGDTGAACIAVTYTGSLPATVRLHGVTSGTGLAGYLTLKVTRGTLSSTMPGFSSCTNFSPDATEHLGSGQGAGVVYNGTLAGFPDDYGAGVVDPSATSPRTWAANETHAYRFDVTQQDDSAAQGLNASQTFTWEARNT